MKKDVILNPQEQLFLLRLPHKLRGTWMLWRLGMDPYHHMARQTFYRHADQLEKYKVYIRGDNPYATSIEEPGAPKGHVDESEHRALKKPLPKQYAQAEALSQGKRKQQMDFLELDK